ncbi:MAG: potassium channel family protein [Lachnospiraceae bacterium]
MKKTKARVKKSILVIGVGRFGRHMCQKFIENDHDVMVIDINEERADASADYVQQIMIGDASDERFMKTIGVPNFDLAVIAIGDNFQTVLEITVLLKDLGCKYVVARANREVHQNLLLRNGADYVVYAEKSVAERLAIRLAADNIFDFIELTPEFGIYEIAPPKQWVGKSIINLSIRNKYKVSIMAVKKGDKIHPMPSPDYVFKEDETVMIMGNNEDVQAITKLPW